MTGATETNITDKLTRYDRRAVRAGVFVLIAAVLGLGLVGCAQTVDEPEPTTSSAYTFTDDLGNTVTVDNPQRVVALMGSFANAWELAGGTLVGATSDAFEFGGYELTSPDIVQVGDFSSPNIEEIIALEPDFVILTSAATGRDGAAAQVDLKDTLESSGITVAYFEVVDFEDYLRQLRIFTDITGRDDLYKVNGQDVADEIESIKAEVPADAEPSVLLMTTFSGGTRVQNSETQTGIMLEELGANNLAEEHPSVLRDFSLEAVIEMNPDFIFVIPMGNDDEAAMKNLTEETEANPAWATLDAVQDGNFITLAKELFRFKPNNNWAEAYRTLFNYLYQ
ncbi:MAG: ABC transporter substrate-binding protein [Coriobacteriia bacterium]|nr:ABC transporter substrate-binding protein [Coriobacteriia bacterium]